MREVRYCDERIGGLSKVRFTFIGPNGSRLDRKWSGNETILSSTC